MAKLTRRGFFVRTSAGALSVSALGLVPGLTSDTEAQKLSAAELSRARLAGPVVAHVDDASTGTISIFVGHQRIVRHDPALVARLLKAAQ